MSLLSASHDSRLGYHPAPTSVRNQTDLSKKFSNLEPEQTSPRLIDATPTLGGRQSSVGELLMNVYSRIAGAALLASCAMLSSAHANIFFSPTQSGGGSVDNILFNLQVT